MPEQVQISSEEEFRQWLALVLRAEQQRLQQEPAACDHLRSSESNRRHDENQRWLA